MLGNGLEADYGMNIPIIITIFSEPTLIWDHEKAGEMRTPKKNVVVQTPLNTFCGFPVIFES